VKKERHATIERTKVIDRMAIPSEAEGVSLLA
jgi:hypothetical protein